jgi:hypothetical protein
MRRHLSRELNSVMVFPVISPAQAIQLGIAAQAVGSAAVSTFADLLRSAAGLLSPAPAEGTKGGCATPACNGNRPGGTADLAVLSGQIDSLLSRISERVRQLVTAGDARLPAAGVTLARDAAGNLAVSGQGQNVPALSQLLQQDGLLQSLFSALGARRQLLDSTTGNAGPSGPLLLHVDAA